jgi:hypothetical protein
MSELKSTNLVLITAPLPADWQGDPQDMFRAFVERTEIKSPVGTSFFITSSTMPSTNQGPWLKDGTQWYVWSESKATYVPQDISASTATLFTVSDVEPGEPGEGDANIWLRTSSGRVIAWYYWNGDVWRPGGNVPPSGPTTSRPTVPKDLEQYFDTDINALLHWERGAWRTVSGVPGDVKFVTTELLATALTNNPGWKYLGEELTGAIGRVLGVASEDPGATPASSFATASGISSRDSRSTAGAETVVLTSAQIEAHTHLVGALSALNSNNDARFYRIDDADNYLAPSPRPPNYAEVKGQNTVNGTKVGTLPDPSDGTILVTSKQLSLAEAEDYTEAAEAHENLQPTLFLWALTKT